jgi:hypothetical protein
MKVASDIEYILAIAIGKRLIERFAPEVGDESNMLAVGVINYAFLKKPGDANAERYRDENFNVIVQEAKAICLDAELSYAFSLLYSFMLMLIGPKDVGRSNGLLDKAIELNIELRTQKEFCNSSDPWKFLEYVKGYADHLWNRDA